jgi:hypothetical protein
MAYETLMVYVGLGSRNDELLQFTADLAVRFQAGVIGIAALQPSRVGAGEGYLFWDHSLADSEAIRNELEVAEAEFRKALQCRGVDLEWRSASMCASIADYLAREVQNADVLIIGIAADVFISNRRVNACDFAVQLGKPVIIVPTPRSYLSEPVRSSSSRSNSSGSSVSSRAARSGDSFSPSCSSSGSSSSTVPVAGLGAGNSRGMPIGSSAAAAWGCSVDPDVMNVAVPVLPALRAQDAAI